MQDNARGSRVARRSQTARAESLEPRALLSGVSAVAQLDGTPISDAALFHDAAYFFAAAPSGAELWKSDGTPAGTARVTTVPYHHVRFDGNAPNADIAPRSLVAAGDALYFVTRTDSTLTADVALWRSDGTAAGTHAVPSDPLGDRVIPSDSLVPLNGRVFFAGFGPGGQELWATGGSGDSIGRVKDVQPGDSGSNPHSLQVAGDRLYFGAQLPFQGPYGMQALGNLWQTDGTEDGTTLFGPLDYSASSPFLDTVVESGGQIFYTASVSDSPRMRLWRAPVAPDEPPLMLLSDRISPPAVLGGRLVFAAVTGATSGGNVMGLWSSDGTPQGTAAYWQGAAPVGPMVRLGGGLFFFSENGLWRTDGTAAGTKQLRQFVTDSTVFQRPDPQMRVVDNTLCFIANDGVHGYELWRSDGTTDGTVMAEDVAPGADSGVFRLLGTAGDDLLFDGPRWDANAGVWRWQLMRFDADAPADGNRAPHASAGPTAGYTLDASGRSVRFDAGRSSDADGDVLTYAWDLNNDRQFGDATGVAPELTWGQLQLLGVNAEGTTPVRVRVSDGAGGVAESVPVPLAVSRPGAFPWGAFAWASEAMATDDGAGFTFTVGYEGREPLDLATLDDRDVQVTFPDGSVQWATFVTVADENASSIPDTVQLLATYRFAAPGGGVDVSDAGHYELVVAAGAVTDLSGNTVAGRDLGWVRTAAELEGPTFSFQAPPAKPDSFYEFTVTYADPSGMDVASLDGAALQVRRQDPPGTPAPRQTPPLAADPVSRAQGPDGSWTVTYRVGYPVGPLLDQVLLKDGTYLFLYPGLRGNGPDAPPPGTVTDVWGNPLRALELGRIDVSLPAAGPDVALQSLEVRRLSYGLPGTRATATVSLVAVGPTRTATPQPVPVPVPTPVGVRFLLSRDQFVSDDDPVVATLPPQHVSAKARRLRVNFVVPPGTAPGDYTLLAVADEAGTEVNVANNRAGRPFTIAESYVIFDTSLVTRVARRGRVASLVFQLTNLGTVAARGTVRLTVEIRPPAGPGPSLSVAKSYRINLRPGMDSDKPGKMRMKIPVRIPADWPAGETAVLVTPDPDATMLPLLSNPGAVTEFLRIE